jgi:hypothetical protein
MKTESKRLSAKSCKFLQPLMIFMILEKIAENNYTINGKNAVKPEIRKQNLDLLLKNLTKVWIFLYLTEYQKVLKRYSWIKI